MIAWAASGFRESTSSRLDISTPNSNPSTSSENRLGIQVKNLKPVSDKLSIHANLDTNLDQCSDYYVQIRTTLCITRYFLLLGRLQKKCYTLYWKMVHQRDAMLLVFD
jgi:hypothetical protein